MCLGLRTKGHGQWNQSVNIVLKLSESLIEATLIVTCYDECQVIAGYFLEHKFNSS